MAASSSPRLFFAVTVLLLLLTVSSLKLPFHPRDLLPLLPRRVSWPLLNSLNSAVDLLPTYIGSASIKNDAVEWKGACFYENKAWLELNNKSGSEFGGGTLHIKVDKAHSWTCMDIYVFVTPYRVTWDWYFISREHTMEFKEWEGKAEYEHVKRKGVSIFLMEAGMLGTLRALWDVFPLFTNTGWGENSNIAFLEKHMGANFYARPEPWEKASRLDGLTGVWVGDEKVAAIGIRVSKWMTYHGLALNVTTDLAPFNSIVPCGIRNRRVGSIKGLIENGESDKLEDSKLIDLAHESLLKEFSEVFQLQIEKQTVTDRNTLLQLQC